MATDFLDANRRRMEDAFFMERDRKLIEQFKEIKRLEETKQNLARVSGIANDAVLQKLVSLNIRAETVASMALIPLVAVAWADGRVEEKEKDAILKAVDKSFAKEGSIDHALLSQWLSHRPPPELLAAWTEYVKELGGQLTAQERAALRKEVLDHAALVARAAGSFLGITSGISREEQTMLAKLEQAFDAAGGKTPPS